MNHSSKLLLSTVLVCCVSLPCVAPSRLLAQTTEDLFEVLEMDVVSRELHDVKGAVYEYTHTIGEALCAKALADPSLSDRDLELALIEGRYAVGAVVTLRSSAGHTATAVANKHGHFVFPALPDGDYELFVEAPSAYSEGEMATGTYGFKLPEYIIRPVLIAISPHAITVKGRVTTDDGSPVAGAMVVGSLVPNDERKGANNH